MLRWLSLLVAILGFGVFGGSLLLKPPLECHLLTLTKTKEIAATPSLYCGRPSQELEKLWQQLDEQRELVLGRIAAEEEDFGRRMMELSQVERTRRDNAIIEEPESLKALRLEHVNILAEQNDIRSALRIHDLHVGLVGLATGALGAILFVLSFVFARVAGRGGRTAAFDKAVVFSESEKWLTPEQAEGQLATMFDNKATALAKLWNLRPVLCNYCSKKLPLEPAGKIEHVTLLKKAPADVKAPKRIVLGAGFMVLPPEHITCVDCGHKNKI